MQLIAGLEPSPRQVYCGAIGYFAPGREAQFNVAIRSMLVDKKNQRAEYGVGGGIVWDSEPMDEWAETQTKARILFEHPESFDLLETLRWTPEEGWYLVEQHLERLHQSAEYFDFPVDKSRIRNKLADMATGFGGVSQRARMTVSKDGRINIETAPWEAGQNPTWVGLAGSPVNSNDRFLYHKTTRREVYQQKLAEVPGVDEVLLWNERGEITESTIANLVYEWEGELFTPPVEAGLLPGTYRAWLLKEGKASERRLRKSELAQCSRVYLVNSVRGMWEIQVHPPEPVDLGFI
jgi:para-aminobenzoate synthetase/4-amino-4-deoxychorismate lyase